MSDVRALIGPRSPPIRPPPTCAAVLASALAGACPIAAHAGTGVPDTQLWSELDVNAPLTANTSITGLGQLRLSESLSNPTLTTLGLEMDYKTGEWTLGGGYRHQLSPNREGEDIKVTQIALLRATWKRRFGRGTFVVRARFDDTLNAASDPWIGRLRPEYRWATEGLGPISYLYASDEVFFRFSESEFYRNRFRAGMNLVFGERSSLLLYYQRQDSKEQTPGAINALGLEFDFTFR